MFTGIIQGTGIVKSITPHTENRSARRMRIDLGKCASSLEIGHSVAINGVCLTATAIQNTVCTFEMIQETMDKTGLGSLREGHTTNIERSLRVGDRLEGHFVLGHVDGTGTIADIHKGEKEVRLCVTVPESLTAHIVPKGSIAIDGVSLTVTRISGDTVCVSLIPHTMEMTNFGTRHIGDTVNIETDILGKYALKQQAVTL